MFQTLADKVRTDWAPLILRSAQAAGQKAAETETKALSDLLPFLQAGGDIFPGHALMSAEEIAWREISTVLLIPRLGV